MQKLGKLDVLVLKHGVNHGEIKFDELIYVDICEA